MTSVSDNDAAHRKLSTIFREIAQQNRVSSPRADQKIEIANSHAPFRTKDSWQIHPLKPVQLNKGINQKNRIHQLHLDRVTSIEAGF
jgi:hypothetical protein